MKGEILIEVKDQDSKNFSLFHINLEEKIEIKSNSAISEKNIKNIKKVILKTNGDWEIK